MNDIRKEVRDLISVNEKIQSALTMGERLTDDEAGLIRMCAGELLERVPVSDSDPWYRREEDGKAERASGRIPTDR